MASMRRREPSSGSKVLSRRIVFGTRRRRRPPLSATQVGSTAWGSSPRARSWSTSPRRPKEAKSTSRETRRRSPAVRIAKRSSRRPVRWPTPGSWSMGRPVRKACSWPGQTSATPPGLASLPARRARVTLVPMPMVTGSRSSSQICRRRRAATSKAGPSRRAVPERSTRRSSMEATCTSGVKRITSRAMSSRRRFAAWESPRRKIAWGQRRWASSSRMPGWMP